MCASRACDGARCSLPHLLNYEFLMRIFCCRYFDLVRDLRQNKGEILKASVDYIKRMKADKDGSKQTESRMRSLEQENRQLLIRIQVSRR